MRENPIITKWSELREKPFIIFTFPDVWNTIWCVSCGDMKTLYPNWILSWNWTDRSSVISWYTKAALTDETGTKKEILTFGPVSIAPEFQRKGYGTSLIEYSLQRAAEMGYDAVVIVGSPANYVHLGFQSCRRYDICVENGKYPAAMMGKELSDGALKGKKWVYRDSPVMSAIDPREAQRYDDTLTPMEKKNLPSQEEFYILSNSFIE